VHTLMYISFSAITPDPIFDLQQSSCKGLKQHGLYVLHAVLEILLRRLGKVHTLVCFQKLLQYKMHAAFDMHQNFASQKMHCRCHGARTVMHSAASCWQMSFRPLLMMHICDSLQHLIVACALCLTAQYMRTMLSACIIRQTHSGKHMPVPLRCMTAGSLLQWHPSCWSAVRYLELSIDSAAPVTPSKAKGTFSPGCSQELQPPSLDVDIFCRLAVTAGRQM